MDNTADSSQDEQITQMFHKNHELIEALNNLRQKLKSPIGEPQRVLVEFSDVREEMTEEKR